MTGRERLLATLYREPVDRVPISTYELTSIGPWGWAKDEPSYRNLMAEVTVRCEALPLWCASMPPDPREVAVDSTQWQEGNFTVTRTTIHTPLGELTTVHKEEPA